MDIREVKDWFYFDVGSYWVFEEENSGKRDSIYVLPEYQANDTGSYYFSTRVYSTHNDCQYHFWTASAVLSAQNGNNMVEKSIRSTSVTRSKSSVEEGLIGESLCFLFYPEINRFVYNKTSFNAGSNRLTVQNFKNSMSLLGRTFEDVVLMAEDHTVVENSQPTKHYYAKGVGLIKKELIDSNQVWNLIDYHIEN